MQFFDNQGKPLSHGTVTAFNQSGYSLVPIYDGYGSLYKLPNPATLDAGGRYGNGDSYHQPQTTYYNMVATAADGTTVIQTLNNSQTQPLYEGGTNMSILQDDPFVNVFYVRSSVTDPIHNQGRSYLWNVQSTQNATTDGTPINAASYSVASKNAPRIKDEVVYIPGLGYKFLRSGAYNIESTSQFGMVAWPTDFTMYGRIISVPGGANPTSKTYNSNVDTLVDNYGRSTTEAFTFSATAGDVINIQHYILNENTAYSASVKMTLMITRYGERFNQGHSTPITSFISTPTGGAAPLSVQFTDTSTEFPTSWLWDFGDRNTSTLQNPLYTYTSAQLDNFPYKVSLTATNSSGPGNTAMAEIAVTGVPPGIIYTFPFSVTNTASATQNTFDIRFWADIGQTIVVCTQGLAGTSTADDTYIRLGYEGGPIFMQNDDSGGSPNNLASYILVPAPESSWYIAYIGGYSDTAASGVCGYQVT
jgi:PKD repeat protein